MMMTMVMTMSQTSEMCEGGSEPYCGGENTWVLGLAAFMRAYPCRLCDRLDKEKGEKDDDDGDGDDDADESEE